MERMETQMFEERGQETQTVSAPQKVFERMIGAANRHDLEAMVSCFSPEFISEQPFHPEQSFTGQGGVRKNWSLFFTTIPDIRIDIVREVTQGDIVWAELHFHGLRVDGKEHSIRGVTLTQIRADQIIWTRLYIEPAP
jgi:predicted SnoaL-like aldol condensation-catalyzing enzyme